MDKPDEHHLLQVATVDRWGLRAPARSGDLQRSSDPLCSSDRLHSKAVLERAAMTRTPPQLTAKAAACTGPSFIASYPAGDDEVMSWSPVGGVSATNGDACRPGQL